MRVRFVPRVAFVFGLLCLALSFFGCANYTDQLNRAEFHFQHARYEAALVNLEDLELHLGGLSTADRVRYANVRGMAHLRLDQRSDARHWLSVAREDLKLEPTAMSAANRATLEQTINGLDNPSGTAPASAASSSASSSADAGRD